jgi:hypothetical protein
MMRVILAALPLIASWSLACDSPHRRPPVDADADADADSPDADAPDDGDVVDVPDYDIPDGWPPRDNCQPTPQNGVKIGGFLHFFSVPYTLQGVTLALSEPGFILYDSGRQCKFYNGTNVWQQEIFQYNLMQKEELLLVAFPAPQFQPHEFNGKIYFNSNYVEYQPGATGNPWAGNSNIWVLEDGVPRIFMNWCQTGYGCLERGVSKAGKMLYYEYDPVARPLLSRMMVLDLNTMENRLIDDQHEAPMVEAVGDRAVFWNYGPCGTFRYYDIEREVIVENPSYNVFAAQAWGKYIAWDNCVPSGSYVLDVETGVVRILDEELNLDPNDNQMSLHTGYENLVALADRARDVPEPGTAAHLWLYDLDTRVERRITSEAAKWTWGSRPVINCEWAIVTLMYGKNGTNIEHYPRAALNLQQAGILDENCHLIPGPSIEFTLEEFITASGFTLEGYDPSY